MRILEDTKFTFDDVLLEPQYSTVESRHTPCTDSGLGGLPLAPIMIANMETTGTAKMARALGYLDILVPLHRFCTIEEQVVDLLEVKRSYPHLAAVSVGLDDLGRVEKLVDAGAKFLFLDVAYANTKRVKEQFTELVNKYKTANWVVGNTADDDCVTEFLCSGAVAVKVGVGPGRTCKTREVTGCGVPQLSAIIECAKGYNDTLHPIIADGGIRSSGDIVKALAAGASFVMVGSLFAGCPEASGDVVNGQKRYRGLASKAAQVDRFGKLPEGIVPEGVETFVACQPPALEVAQNLLAGIRQGMAMIGASDLEELREKAVFQRVTTSTILENETR